MSARPPLFASQYRPGLFAHQVVLVTGGGSGVGRSTAMELVSLGARVVIAGRSRDKLARVLQEIKTYSDAAADYIVMDIRHPEQVADGIKSVLHTHGRLDALVNAAGGQFASPAGAISTRGWKAVIDLNLNGTWNVIRLAHDLWMKDHGGRIVTVIAEMWQGFPMMAHTGAARAALDNLHKTLAVEWAPSQIRLNCVAPGLVIGNGMNNYPRAVQEQVVNSLSWQSPAGRMATEDEVSAAICFLLSPGAAYINGTTLK
ncbi:hypothetical protein HDU91_000335, partial [Kappamyces sp. JEL0680]